MQRATIRLLIHQSIHQPIRLLIRLLIHQPIRLLIHQLIRLPIRLLIRQPIRLLIHRRPLRTWIRRRFVKQTGRFGATPFVVTSIGSVAVSTVCRQTRVVATRTAAPARVAAKTALVTSRATIRGWNAVSTRQTGASPALTGDVATAVSIAAIGSTRRIAQIKDCSSATMTSTRGIAPSAAVIVTARGAGPAMADIA
jgi:hypothetical protein